MKPTKITFNLTPHINDKLNKYMAANPGTALTFICNQAISNYIEKASSQKPDAERTRKLQLSDLTEEEKLARTEILQQECDEFLENNRKLMEDLAD